MPENKAKENRYEVSFDSNISWKRKAGRDPKHRYTVYIYADNAREAKQLIAFTQRDLNPKNFKIKKIS